MWYPSWDKNYPLLRFLRIPATVKSLDFAVMMSLNYKMIIFFGSMFQIWVEWIHHHEPELMLVGYILQFIMQGQGYLKHPMLLSNDLSLILRLLHFDEFMTFPGVTSLRWFAQCLLARVTPHYLHRWCGYEFRTFHELIKM